MSDKLIESYEIITDDDEINVIYLIKMILKNHLEKSLGRETYLHELIEKDKKTMIRCLKFVLEGLEDKQDKVLNNNTK
jgi:hypothetical protein